MKNRKRFAAWASAAVMCASIPAILPSAAQTLIGDVNQDGSVGVADAVSLYQYLHNLTKLDAAALSNADVKTDGIVNVFDFSLLKKMIISDVEPVANTVYIHLKGNTATVEGDTNKVVSVDGTTVKITGSGIFYVDGELTDGQLFVETGAEDVADVELVLTDVTMTNSTKPAIYTSAANGSDKTKITLKGTSTITDTSAAAYTEADTAKTMGVIFSNNKLTFTKNSTGSLTINSSMNNAISCEKKLNLNGGMLTINTSQLTTDAVTECDADAINCDKDIEIEGATLDIDSSADGIKTDGALYLYSGNVSVKAGNDAVQAATLIDVQGGNVIASGDRGFRLDANGTLNIDGGTVMATATDYQVNGNEVITITGKQASMLLDMAAEWKKDSAITIGTKTFTPNKKYDYVLVSDPSVTASGEYKVYIGGAQAKHAAGNTFANTSAASHYTAVELLEGGETFTGSGEAASVVFSASGVKLYDAQGNETTASDGVNVNGSIVTVTKSGTYTFSGESTQGQIIVNTDDTAEPEALVTLELDGLTLSNETAAPIFIQNAGDEAVISVKNGTVNTISDGKSHTDTDTSSEGETSTVNGAIYAKDDLKIKGKGTLNVNGNTEDGIVCKDDLKLWNGTINVTAMDDGIRGNDSVRIGDTTDSSNYGTLSVHVTTTSGDGIKSTSTETGKGYVTISGGSVTIDSYADGIQAEQNFTMTGGTVDITTYEGSSYGGSSSGSNTQWGGGMNQDGNSNKTDISAKGIKAVGLYDTTGTTWQSGGELTISGGSLTVDSSDDSLHAGGDIAITGGEMTLSSADDAIHSDHTVNIGEGSANTYDDLTIIIPTAYEGVEGMTINQNSGTVIVNTTDDGYNAAGGADSSGNMGGGPGGGWGQGSFGQSSGSYALNLKGGFVRVNASDGDHDGFDSNGTLTISGGITISNGSDAFDAESSLSYTGGVFVEDTGRGGMGGGMMGGGMMGGGSLSTDVSASANISADERITLTDSSGNVIVSFIADKSVSSISAGTGLSGVSIYTGGTLNGSTYFQQLDETQLAAYGGTLSGGTKLN